MKSRSRRRQAEDQYLDECETWHCRKCKATFLNHPTRRVKCPYCGAGLRSRMLVTRRIRGNGGYSMAVIRTPEYILRLLKRGKAPVKK